MTTASSQTATTLMPISVLSDLLAGLQPAFLNQRTGEAHLSQNEDGIPAREYGFSGLPDEWVIERDTNGKAVALHPDIIAGYWRDARFVALSQINQMPMDA